MEEAIRSAAQYGDGDRKYLNGLDGKENAVTIRRCTECTRTCITRSVCD